MSCAQGRSVGWEKIKLPQQFSITKNTKILSKYNFSLECNSVRSSLLNKINFCLLFFLPAGGPTLHSRPENHSRTFQSSWQQAQKQIHQHCGLWVSCEIWLCLPLWIPIMFIKRVFIFLIILTNMSMLPLRRPQPGEITGFGRKRCQTFGLH